MHLGLGFALNVCAAEWGDHLGWLYSSCFLNWKFTYAWYRPAEAEKSWDTLRHWVACEGFQPYHIRLVCNAWLPWTITSALALVHLPSIYCICMKIVQRKDEVTSTNQQGGSEEESCKRWWKVNPCAERVATLEAYLLTALLKDSLLVMETQCCLVLLPGRDSKELYFSLYFEGYMCIPLETIPNLKEMKVM